MKSLTIKDLEISKDLTREELSAVRGGGIFGAQGGTDVQTSGLNLFSPVTIVNVPTLTALDIHPVTNVNVDVANVIGSALTGVVQQHSA